MENLSFGNWLKLKRKSLDLTRERLANLVGCSGATIRKIEAEERHPSAQIAERLATIFKIPENEQKTFIQFARGDWQSTPTEPSPGLSWNNATKLPRSNIPAATDSFIAREKEINIVHEYLSKENIRLVTLMGPPGIGKTCLSIEVARLSISDFEDGTFFVALAPVDDPSLIASAIAQALGYAEIKNNSIIKQLKEGIGDKHILLVIDNCEHLIDDVSALASELLSGCSHLNILATSRESFRIPGEWLYPVPAFDLPPETVSIDMAAAPNFPALTLFAERARAVRPDFVLTSENIKTVSAICAHLDGLPLAIELIASRMRFMSPESLLSRLNERYILSADGMRAPSERQKTLKNAIEWSYNLLSGEEQKLFAYLSVFSGGFTLDMGEAIFSQAVTEKSVPNLIASLLDKSLLQLNSAHRETRYSMLVTIQEFARERLGETENEANVRNWHMSYFLNLAEQADKEIHGPAQVEWMDRLEVEHDNFRAALDWSITNQQTELALRLLNALCWPWLMRTHYSEIRSWFEKVRSLPNNSAYPALYARLLNFMGHMNWLLGDYREAQSFLKESQAIWLKMGSTGERGMAEALMILGMVASSNAEDLKAAESFLEQSFELYEKHADQRGMAFDLIHLGWLAIVQNNNMTAFALAEKSMTLFEQSGDIWGKSRVSDLLGQLFLRQENYEKARSYFEQNLEFDEEIKLKPGIVNALGNLGDLHRYQGDYIQAKQYYQRSLDISRTYGMKADWGLSFYFLGLTALHQNDYPAARQHFADHFKAERESLDKVSAIILILSQAAISAGTNQPERASRLSGAAQAILEKMDYRISRFNQAEFDRHIQIARDQLSATDFEEAVEQGRVLSIEQAIEYALKI